MFVGTSWKMNKTLAEAEAWCDVVRYRLDGGAAEDTLFVIPPFTALAHVSKRLAGSRFLIGAQNVHWETHGAWTGEISAAMARDAGAALAEIGHSERRRWFAETDETVALKAAAALRAGLRPLVCVGESREDRDVGAADLRLAEQARSAAAGGDALILAYEPIWAIGEGAQVAEPAYVAERVARLREAVAPLAPPVLYGGSVDETNAAAMVGGADVDGLFIGRAALDPDRFADIVALVAATR
jgi:triosephosphate isomerase